MQIVKPEYTNDATLLSSNVDEADYAPFDIAASYSIDDTVIYIADNIHWVVRSLINSNVGNTPTGLKTDPNWVKISETNRWKMFDLKTTSQTENGTSINVTIAGVGFNNALGILNCNGSWLDLVARDINGDIFYEYSQSLVSTEGIYDFYTYIFSPLVPLTDVVLLDLPPYALATYELTITGTNVKCGTFLIGNTQDSGLTQYNMALGITDYSIKSADEFGDFVITERPYSKTMDITTYVPNYLIDSLYNFCANNRATPLLWVGKREFSTSFVYGFFTQFNQTVVYETKTRVDFKIISLS